MSRRDVRAAIKQAAEGNLLERAIATVAPQWAAKRLRANMFLAMAGGYTGASGSRRQTKEWQYTKGQSADADILADLPTLRDRSSDLIRNEPVASGAISGVVTSVVGTGLALQSRVDREVLNLSEQQAAAWQKNTEREFRMWFESTACDATRTQNGYGLQLLVLRSALERGDCFTTTPMRAIVGMPYRLCLQVFEADQVSNPGHKADTNELAGGVALDAMRAPMGYHFRKTHPGSVNQVSSEWDYLEAFGARTGRRQVIHIYDRLRPGQTRGVPYLAPVIETLKMLGRYTEAELMAAVISGMFTVFIESDRGGIDPADPSGIAAETGATGTDRDVKMGPGAIVDMNPGEKTSFADPSRPNPAFEGFVQSLCRFIGIALELPYEVLIKHFTASYSASRGALLEAWKFYRRRRAWLADMWLNPVFEAWMDEAVAIGRIPAPGYFDDPVMRRAYLGCEWVGDGPISVDPLKDVNAAKERIALGISTRQKEAALYDGGDWEQNHLQLKREHDKRVTDGLDGAPAAPLPPDDNEDDGGSDRETLEDERAAAQREDAAATRQAFTAMVDGQARIAAAIASQPAPVIRVQAGDVHVTVPEREITVEAVMPASPDVHVNVQPPAVKVDVAAAVVNVEPTPVTVSNDITVAPAEIRQVAITSLPTRETTGEIERDDAGNIVSTVQVERDR